MGTRDIALVLFVGTALVLSAVIFVFQAEQRASAADAGNMMMEIGLLYCIEFHPG